jgi:hypothetical protein
MDSKSKQYGVIDNGNDPGADPFINIKGNRGPNPDQMGSSGPGNPVRTTAGWEGPGIGHAKKLNSDDQMPVNPGCCT